MWKNHYRHCRRARIPSFVCSTFCVQNLNLFLVILAFTFSSKFIYCSKPFSGLSGAGALKVAVIWRKKDGRGGEARRFKLKHSFLKMGQHWPLFHLFSVFSNKQYNFYNKSMWKNVMSIQYPVLGFELMTFGTWVSSHNH